MRKILALSLLISILFISFNKKSNQNTESDMNPFLTEYNTPYNVPPFEKIMDEHYLPAFKEGIRLQNLEIEAIIQNTEDPGFENTIVAFDNSGVLLSEVRGVFYNILNSNTSNNLQKIAKEAAPLLSGHRDDIILNKELFAKIKTVFDNKVNLDLNVEQGSLLEKTYIIFIRGGANLKDKNKTRLREINESLSVLSLNFGDNILAENNKFKMVIDREEDLVGLPQSAINAAAITAKEAGKDGKWMFTIHKPSLIPFLQYSEKRELREKMFKAYTSKGDNNDLIDNKEILKKMVELRIEKAHLLGYKSHAEYVLEENMAKTPENVYSFLNKLWEAALPVAKEEAKEIQGMIDKEGKDYKLEPWDWWFYAEKLRKEKYDLDEEALRPYLVLENVLNGAFEVANKLFGLQFVEKFDMPKYHDDARVFEVLESDGKHLGIMYMDFHPRASKRAGAWMDAFRKQSKRGGKEITPVITINCNFSKPTGDVPALLNFDEVATLFHEFGHGLHGLLSDCTYYLTSGTSVPRDFVELPSQIMENWATEPKVLELYARHYETGELIPAELIERMKKSSYFNQGFITVEYLAASYLDLDWHNISETGEVDVHAFENNSMQKIGLIPEIVVRYRSTYFAHIFSGGYSSGYYSYTWSAWLDADAFEAFKETSLFDQEIAKLFRENVLERGGTEDPMTLYIRFRGAEPKVDALLRRKGML